jgi:hypothetical protein
MTRCIEQNVDWVANLLVYMHDAGYTRVEPTVEAEDAWTALVEEIARHFMFSQVDSWMTGVNKNVPGRQTRTAMVFTGGAPQYRARCEEVAANGYQGFLLT